MQLRIRRYRLLHRILLQRSRHTVIGEADHPVAGQALGPVAPTLGLRACHPCRLEAAVEYREGNVRQKGGETRPLCAVSGYAQFGVESPMVVGIGLWALGIIRAVRACSALDVAAMKSRERAALIAHVLVA